MVYIGLSRNINGNFTHLYVIDTHYLFSRISALLINPSLSTPKLPAQWQRF